MGKRTTTPTTGADSLYAASKTASLQMGKFTRFASGEGFVVTATHLSSDGVRVEGRTLTGKLAHRLVYSSEDIIPTWVNKVANLIKLAWVDVYDHMIKTIIRDHGLPVDDAVDWDARLHNIFRWIRNDDIQNEAIQGAVVSVLVTRDLLGRFSSEDTPNPAGTPLANLVTAYLTQAFKWQGTGNGEAGDKAAEEDALQSMDSVVTIPDTGFGDWSPSGGSAESTEPSPFESTVETDMTGLKRFSKEFGDFVMSKKPRNNSTKERLVMLIFSLALNLDSAEDICEKWSELTGTGANNFYRVRGIMKDYLKEFSRLGHLDPQVQRAIRNINVKAIAAESGLEAKQSETDEIGSPVEDAKGGAGSTGVKAPSRKPLTSSQRSLKSAAASMLKVAEGDHEYAPKEFYGRVTFPDLCLRDLQLLEQHGELLFNGRGDYRPEGGGDGISSDVTAQLCRMGLVEVTPTPGRGRESTLRLTPAGEDALYSGKIPGKVSKVLPIEKRAWAPGHAYDTDNGGFVCRSCAKKDGRKHFGHPYPYGAEEIDGKNCSQCHKSLSAETAKKKSSTTTSHSEENIMAAKFASLKRYAAENPEVINQAIDDLKGKLTQQLENLTVMQEHFGSVNIETDEAGEPTGEVVEITGTERLAGLKRIAANKPEAVEEALGEFYTGMDEILALTENLADHLDITLPDPAAEAEEACSGEECDTSAEDDTQDETPEEEDKNPFAEEE